MSFLTGPNRAHLNGHKEETSYNDIVRVKPQKEVYIPLDNGTNYVFEAVVKEGDLVKVGTLLGRRTGNMIVPYYSPVSGKVGSTKTMMHAVLKPVPHMVIEDDGTYEKVQSFKPLDYTLASREELVEFMMNAGLVGCGGAGFPSYMKYRNPQGLETLMINAVECEPYITSDYRFTETHLDDLKVGVLALLKMSTAKKAVVAIKKTKKTLIAQLKESFSDHPEVEIFLTPDAYPMGWERTLVYQHGKKRYNRLPSEVGYVINNVTTTISFAQALKNGEGLTEKLVTFSGDGLISPCNVLVPYGTKIGEIVQQIGGYACDDVLLIAGGPMMGKTITNDDFVITNYANAITVLKNEVIDALPCMRCGRCNDTCPAGLLPVRINNAEKMKDLDLMVKLNADQCIECGLCSYVCPSKIDVTEGVRKAKRVLALRKK